jgi:hypothetical protein
MSPDALLQLKLGFNERLQSLGQRLRLDRTGAEWNGILLPVNPIDPRLELGDDPRELATLEMRRDGSPDLEHGDVVIQIRPPWATKSFNEGFVKPPLWRVLRRDDNPANFSIRYWLVKITSDDTQPALQNPVLENVV